MNTKRLHLEQTLSLKQPQPQPGVAERCPVSPLRDRDGPSGSPVHRTIRAALVLACMTRDLVRDAASSCERVAVFKALQFASARILHWVKQAGRCGQQAARLRCLAEAACTNMAFRGLLYEEEPSGQFKPRRREMLLNQSRQVGAMIGRLCESVGRAAAAESVHMSGSEDGPGEWAQVHTAAESPYCFRG